MNMDENSNSNNIEYFENNFEQAYFLSNKSMTHSELIEYLKNGDIKEKQIAAINLDYLSSKEDVIILLDNLTGCDGKIREAVALKINQFLSGIPEYRNIFAELSPKIFADATIDINGNICRLIVDSAFILKDYSEFSLIYTAKILDFANEALCELEKFVFKDKKYIINKQLFKLYWCLEALKYFYNCADKAILGYILNKSIRQQEYTIREKAAEVIKNSSAFDSLKKILVNDENYYVRQVFAKSS